MISRIAARVRVRLGDFWWHSLMLFCAFRAADVINEIVELWVVPKYVGPGELGAVLPLVTFATMLALPAYAFAMTFMKEVNALAVRGERGKMKSLLRGVFVGVGVFVVLAVVAAAVWLPGYLEHVRVARGRLVALILVSALLGCVAPVYTNVLQALKRFREISFITVAGAPLRLVAMLVTMPFRPLAGFFVGQSAPPGLSVLASVFCLRRELAGPAEPYWTRPVVRRFLLLFLGMTAYQLAGMGCGLVESTVLRQRLPDLDSAAYYMLTRFADIAGFVSSTLLMTLFPYTAELAERGRPTRPLVLRSAGVMAVTGAALAVVFACFGRRILAVLPGGEAYADYAWAIPWVVGIAVVTGIQYFHTNTEVSAGRFGFLKWWVPLNVAYMVVLPSVAVRLPASAAAFCAAHGIDSLSVMLGWMTAIAAVRLVFCLAELQRQNRQWRERGSDNDAGGCGRAGTAFVLNA